VLAATPLKPAFCDATSAFACWDCFETCCPANSTDTPRAYGWQHADGELHAPTGVFAQSHAAMLGDMCRSAAPCGVDFRASLSDSSCDKEDQLLPGLKTGDVDECPQARAFEGHTTCADIGSGISSSQCGDFIQNGDAELVTKEHTQLFSTASVEGELPSEPARGLQKPRWADLISGDEDDKESHPVTASAMMSWSACSESPSTHGSSSTNADRDCLGEKLRCGGTSLEAGADKTTRRWADLSSDDELYTGPWPSASQSEVSHLVPAVASPVCGAAGQAVALRAAPGEGQQERASPSDQDLEGPKKIGNRRRRTRRLSRLEQGAMLGSSASVKNAGRPSQGTAGPERSSSRDAEETNPYQPRRQRDQDSSHAVAFGGVGRAAHRRGEQSWSQHSRKIRGMAVSTADMRHCQTNRCTAPPFICRKPQCQFFVGIEEDSKFKVVRRVLGPHGQHVKHIAEQTGVKLRLRGRGSKFLEGPDQRESDEPLMLCLSAPDHATYAEAVRLTKLVLEDVYEDYRTYCKRAGRPVPDVGMHLHEGPREGAY